MSVDNLWRGMVSRKSHASDLKNWIPIHSKKPSVGVVLRAGGDPHRSEKPGLSAGDMRQWPKKTKENMHRHSVFPQELCCQFNFDLFNFSRNLLTCSKLVKQ